MSCRTHTQNNQNTWFWGALKDLISSRHLQYESGSLLIWHDSWQVAHDSICCVAVSKAIYSFTHFLFYLCLHKYSGLFTLKSNNVFLLRNFQCLNICVVETKTKISQTNLTVPAFQTSHNGAHFRLSQWSQYQRMRWEYLQNTTRLCCCRVSEAPWSIFEICDIVVTEIYSINIFKFQITSHSPKITHTHFMWSLSFFLLQIKN